MATKLQYRDTLKNKLLSLEDEGYGDFEFSDVELDTYLELSVSRMFPAVYQRKLLPNVALSSYGTSSYLNSVACSFPERVFLVEDATEMTPLLGWQVRPTSIVGLDKYQGAGLNGTVGAVNIYYYDAYELPTDDTTDAGIAAIYKPLVITGALVEALESRHDTGVYLLKNDGAGRAVGHEEMPVVDRLMKRYDQLKRDLEMGLPAVIF